jgi:histidyl-tRNA synthetase
MNTIIYKKPRGTIDICGVEYEKFIYYSFLLEELFKANGGTGLETPAFELENILLNKYGKEAENKLIFKLENLGSDSVEKYALRYDLTVPLERFIMENSIKKMRRYAIGKVYRRDQPSDGRFREFYQGDFDIVGENSSGMINEFVLLKMADTFLKSCGLTQYQILINDTKNLKTILVDKLGIGLDKFKNICQTIDKLDKCEYSELTDELSQKGLSLEQISELKVLLDLNFPVCDETKINFDKLKTYCQLFGFGDKLVFVPSMARGLDYYNGFIWEIKVDSFKPTIISGGRYDNLIPQTSMIGISFGLSRMMGLLKYDQVVWKELYYITTIGKSISLETKLKVMAFLENKLNIKIMLSDGENTKKLIKEINYCIGNKIRYMFVIGENEYASNKVILKDLQKETQEMVDLM